MQELSVRVRVENERQRTRPRHVQSSELLHLGVRLVAINSHRHERLVETGLDRLSRGMAPSTRTRHAPQAARPRWSQPAAFPITSAVVRSCISELVMVLVPVSRFAIDVS